MEANQTEDNLTARTIALGALLAIVFCLLPSGSSCRFFLPPVAAHITYFAPASGTYYPQDEVVSYLQFKNTGREPWNFWVGYSVMDQAEQWYHITSHSVMLNPGQKSPIQNKTWQVPAESACTTGYYRVAMAVWDAAPEDERATMLEYREQWGSFQVLRHFEHFNSFDPNLWYKSSHNLGKSYLDPENVNIDSGRAKITVPAGTLNGGEFASIGYYKYGTYRASMLLPPTPGLVSAFFLFHGPADRNDEIDIEIYNHDGWQIEFTTWVQGVRTNTVKKPLRFDPSTEYHEYRIDFYPQSVSFLVDGQLWQKYTSGLPTQNMRLLVNTWFPDWLPGVPPSTDEYTYVEWMQY